MKKVMAIALMAAVSLGILAGCNKDTSFDQEQSIKVVSREDGSGTRGAFIELFGIQVRGDDGTSRDMTTQSADITTQTGTMLMSVSGNMYAIGYVSLGSLNHTVKAVSIDGAQATPANVIDGSYAIKRPFLLGTKGELDELTQDFLDFILSAEGQDVVSQNYIAVDENPPAYVGTVPAGRLVIAGSSSVNPVMERLKEAYELINTSAVIEIHSSDSTSGIIAAIEGTAQIGMASRDLRDTEKNELDEYVIAYDGIAVIVNNENTAAGDLSKDQVHGIFIGEITKWSDL